MSHAPLRRHILAVLVALLLSSLGLARVGATVSSQSRSLPAGAIIAGYAPGCQPEKVNVRAQFVLKRAAWSSSKPILSLPCRSSPKLKRA